MVIWLGVIEVLIVGVSSFLEVEGVGVIFGFFVEFKFLI